MAGLCAGAEGCEVCFHAAAKVEDWGEAAEFERLNVGGTRDTIVFFVTDGEPVVFRDFLTRMLETQDVGVPDKSVPPGVAGVAALAAERAWRLLRRPGPPPLTRFAVWASSRECTLDISRARAELGYRPVKTRQDGIAELAAG